MRQDGHSLRDVAIMLSRRERDQVKENVASV